MLLLGAGALVLGYILFAQRELLKGRTQSLEKGVVQIATLLEQPTDDPVDVVADFIEKDVAELAAQLNPDPEHAAFWQSYPLYLEDVDQKLFTVTREDLMNYYKIDFATQRPAKDINGVRITEGEGTMDAVLKRIIGAAQYELERLNRTRDQLKKVREELIATIIELNDGKQTQRQQLVLIQEQRNTIASLEDERRQLTARVAELESDKLDLQGQVADMQRQIEELNEEIVAMQEIIDKQRETIAKLMKPTPQGQISASELNNIIKMEAGDKGSVVSVNSDWSYVVLQFDDAALAEIETMRKALEENLTPGTPAVEFFLKRGDAYVAKIKLVQIKRDQKLAVADVLPNWQQAEIKPGDRIFF